MMYLITLYSGTSLKTLKKEHKETCQGYKEARKRALYLVDYYHMTASIMYL